MGTRFLAGRRVGGLMPSLIAWQAVIVVFCAAIVALWQAAPGGSAQTQTLKTASERHSTPLAVSSDASASPAPQAVISKVDLETWLDGLMPSALVRGDMAGAVVVVVQGGKTVLAKGYGYADADRKVPVDSRTTLFRVGSITKLFTATAVMQLVDQGKLDLDRDVNAYLDFKIPPRPGGPVTLRHLLSHRAGFEEAFKGIIRTDIERLEPLGPRLKRWIPRRIYAAGSTPAYSNYSAALAGYIVERRSGLPFDDYVARNILNPLAMTRSTMRQPLPPALTADLSQGFSSGSGGPQPFEYIALAPAGALSATGDDMAHFMLAHLARADGTAPHLLSTQALAEMHGARARGIGPLRRMRVGFYESDVNGREVLAHSGDTLFFHSDLNLFPNEQVGIFISLNSGGKDGAAYSLRAYLLQAFADRYFQGKANDATSFRQSVSPQPISAATRRKHSEMMAGAYESTRRAESSFMSILAFLGQTHIAPDGTLQIAGIEDAAGNLRTWREVQPFVWIDASGTQRMAAEVRGGQVVRISADEMAPIMALDRVPWWRAAAVLLPAIWLSLGVLALTILTWPLGAVYRRRYRVVPSRPPRLRRSVLFARLGSIAVLVTLAAWFETITLMAGDLNLMAPDLDSWLWTLSLGQILTLAAAIIAAGGYARASWQSEAAWLDRAWSAGLTVSLLGVAWIAYSFNLLSFRTEY